MPNNCSNCNKLRTQSRTKDPNATTNLIKQSQLRHFRNFESPRAKESQAKVKIQLFHDPIARIQSIGGLLQHYCKITGIQLKKLFYLSGHSGTGGDLGIKVQFLEFTSCMHTRQISAIRISIEAFYNVAHALKFQQTLPNKFTQTSHQNSNSNFYQAYHVCKSHK